MAPARDGLAARRSRFAGFFTGPQPSKRLDVLTGRNHLNVRSPLPCFMKKFAAVIAAAAWIVERRREV